MRRLVINEDMVALRHISGFAGTHLIFVLFFVVVDGVSSLPVRDAACLTYRH